MSKRSYISDHVDLDKFLAETWRQRIARLGVFQITDPQIVFDAAVTLAKGGVGPNMRCYLGGRMIEDERHHRLKPIHGDSNWDSYAKRVDEEFPGQDWAVIFNDPHESHPAFADQSLGFFEPITRRVGLPLLGFSAEIFVGRYKDTPFGVHQDPGLESFYQPIHGNKRFWFWPPPTWESSKNQYPPPPNRLQEHAATATIIDVVPGEVIYWPADYWHIAETPEFAVALGVSFTYPADDAEAIKALNRIAMNALELELELAPPGSDPPHSFPFSGENPADIIHYSLLESVSRVQETSKRLPEIVADWWLQRCSNHGAKGAPDAGEAGEIDLDKTLVLSEGTALLRRRANGELKVASLGALWIVNDGPIVTAALQALADGESIQTGKFIADFLRDHPQTDPEEEERKTEIQHMRELFASMVEVGVLKSP